MDKRTIIGIVLIVLITLMMPFYQKWITGDQPATRRPASIPADSIIVSDVPDSAKIISAVPAQESEETEIILPEPADSVLIQEGSEEKTITIENDLLVSTWSSAGGGNPTSWELKNYQYYQGGLVNLIQGNSLKVNFLNFDGKEISLNDYNFHIDSYDGKKIDLNRDNPEFVMEFYLPVRGGRIVKTITFYYDRYSYNLTVRFEGLQEYVINRRYFIGWDKGLPSSEKNIDDDLNYSRAYAFMGDELFDLDASDNYGEEDLNGSVDWAAIRSKYFLVSLIPSDPSRTNGVTIGGVKSIRNEVPEKNFDFNIEKQFEPLKSQTDDFTVYMGPLDYYVLKKYDADLEDLIMNKGWYERIFRPISLLIIPAFKFLYRFIPNYGFVIIVFSILIKLLLHPLTKKSYQSMSEMQYLQPKMTELREKYKDDPQRINKEMMKLYKEHKINPLGGCIPMLLQMPVLISLFNVFRSTIQLRNQPFILWINDLSAPDALYLGFELPFIGDNIHILPIFMGLTMIWQSKMTMTDPKQKLMVYFMPVFLIFIFYSLPSGLNLYYAIFNVLSMVQTRMIKKKMHPNSEPAPAPKAATPQISKSGKSGKGKRKK
jgi:YidC/Oxa1 family membrane protein insertase